MRDKKIYLLLLCALSTFTLHSKKVLTILGDRHSLSPHHKQDWKPGFQWPNLSPHECKNFFNNGFSDIFNVGKQIFTLDSMKIVAITAPFYLMGRKADKKVHDKFYDPVTHKNLHHPPDWLKKVALHNLAMIAPVAFYGLEGIFSNDPFKRRTTLVFGGGFLWAIGSKMLIKKFKGAYNTRPKNQVFDPSTKVYGGCPSGHMTSAAYFATYLALTKGPLWGVFMGAYVAGIAGLSIAVNHHYLSQVVAGTGLGVIIGFAAHRVIDSLSTNEKFSVACGPDLSGGLSLTVAYTF